MRDSRPPTTTRSTAMGVRSAPGSSGSSAPQPTEGGAPSLRIQNGWLLSCGGCQQHWNSLAICNHGDSMTGRFGRASSPSAGVPCAAFRSRSLTWSARIWFRLLSMLPPPPLTAATAARGDGLPRTLGAPKLPSSSSPSPCPGVSILKFVTKNGRDTGKSQSIWTDSKMERPSAPPPRAGRGGGRGGARYPGHTRARTTRPSSAPRPRPRAAAVCPTRRRPGPNVW
jgi:hypothetical protein